MVGSSGIGFFELAPQPMMIYKVKISNFIAESRLEWFLKCGHKKKLIGISVKSGGLVNNLCLGGDYHVSIPRSFGLPLNTLLSSLL